MLYVIRASIGDYWELTVDAKSEEEMRAKVEEFIWDRIDGDGIRHVAIDEHTHFDPDSLDEDELEEVYEDWGIDGAEIL